MMPMTVKLTPLIRTLPPIGSFAPNSLSATVCPTMATRAAARSSMSEKARPVSGRQSLTTK